MQSRCVHQRRLTSHRSQVSTKTCPGKVSIGRLRVRTPTTFRQPVMASNRLIAMPNVKPACCRHGLQRCQRALDARARCASRAPSQRRRISSTSSERAVPRVFSVNPTRLTCRNELDSDGACLECAFVAEDVHVGTTGIDKPRPLCVHSGLAVGIVPFIVRED